jgi:hypothetical protein
MIRVAEQNPAADLAQIARQHRLYSSLRPDGHEARRLDHAVRRNEPTEARFGRVVCLENRKPLAHEIVKRSKEIRTIAAAYSIAYCLLKG